MKTPKMTKYIATIAILLTLTSLSYADDAADKRNAQATRQAEIRAAQAEIQATRSAQNHSPFTKMDQDAAIRAEQDVIRAKQAQH
jgi:uncharacterized MAPEG superfamily protein